MKVDKNLINLSGHPCIPVDINHKVDSALYSEWYLFLCQHVPLIITRYCWPIHDQWGYSANQRLGCDKLDQWEAGTLLTTSWCMETVMTGLYLITWQHSALSRPASSQVTWLITLPSLRPLIGQCGINTGLWLVDWPHYHQIISHWPLLCITQVSNHPPIFILHQLPNILGHTIKLRWYQIVPGINK